MTNMRNKADQTNYLPMYIHNPCKLFLPTLLLNP